MEFTGEWDKAKWDAFVRRIQARLSSSTIDNVLEAIAYKGLRMFASILPKRTGALQRSWSVQKKGIGQYQIFSTSKVALFLEEGTKDHGPKTKKFLYIPLRRGAAVWRKGLVIGKDYILVKRVKGIRAMRYLKPVSQDVLGEMVKDFGQKLATAGA